MTKDEIIKEVSTNKSYKDFCRSIAGHLADDLFQELIIYLIEQKGNTLERIKAQNDKGFDFYIVKSMMYMFTNKYSRFFKTYRAHFSELPEIKDEHDPHEKANREKMIAVIANELDVMEHEYGSKYPYHVNLFRAYVNENCNVRQLDRKANINYMTAWNQIQIVKRRLLTRIKKEQKNGTL